MITVAISPLVKLLPTVLGIYTPDAPVLPLSAEAEFLAFRRARAGDSMARQTLILCHLHLVSHAVQRYSATARKSENLLSVGTVGLVRAVDTFPVESGTRFAPYAARCIRDAMRARENAGA